MQQSAERNLLQDLKPGLRVLDDAALNAEPAPALLDADLTPISAFFVRNNGSVPEVPPGAAASWTLTIDGEVAQSASTMWRAEAWRWVSRLTTTIGWPAARAAREAATADAGESTVVGC